MAGARTRIRAPDCNLGLLLLAAAGSQLRPFLFRWLKARRTDLPARLTPVYLNALNPIPGPHKEHYKIGENWSNPFSGLEPHSRAWVWDSALQLLPRLSEAVEVTCFVIMKFARRRRWKGASST